MKPRRPPRRRSRGAGNVATEADGSSYSGEGDGGGASESDAKGSAAAGRSPALESGVAVAESTAADTNMAAPFFRDDGGGVSEEEGSAAGGRPRLDAGAALSESTAADTNKVALFFGDDGGGVSEAGRSAAGRRPCLDATVDVVEAAEDTNKVAPFVGEDDEVASQADGSFAGRREAGDGVMAPALDASTKKVEPFAGSYAIGDTTGSRGSYAGRCDDSVPPFDPELPNATVSTLTIHNGKEPLENTSASIEYSTEPDTNNRHQSCSHFDHRAEGSSLASGEERHGKLTTIAETIMSCQLKDIVDDDLYRNKRTSTIHPGVGHLDTIRAVNESSTDKIDKLHQSDSQNDSRAQGSQGSSLAGGAESLSNLSIITKTILSWQLEDIMNDDLYRDKVDMMRNHLESIKSEEYINAISNLVIEECRANLQASLQRIKSSPSAYSVTTVLNTDLDFVYFIDINLHLVADAKHRIHMAREGDIFVFSTLSHQDKDFSHSFTCFGMVVGTSVHSNFHQGFKVVMLGKQENINFGCFLINVSDTINVWNTLEFYNKKDVFSGTNYIMKLNELVNTRCDLCNNQSVLTSTASKYLTLSKSQLGIAKHLSAAVQCTHEHVVKMVTGPPGSGKTRIIVAVIHLLYQFDFRVLVCVSQKIATFQLWKLLEESGYPINDIIVLDSLKGIRLPKKFRQTCLQIKSVEYHSCLVMVRQWISEMQMLLHLKMYCPSSCNHVPKDSRCSRTGLPLFTSNLYRKAFLPLAIDMKNCLIELRDKFSKMCLPNNNKSIATVLNWLEDFQNLLFSEAPSEEHIQRAFGYLAPLPLAEKMIELTSGAYGPAIARQLNNARLRFIDFLQDFGKSIIIPKFGNRKQIENYCIEHSRVIIGTPESIFQLHSMKNNSINLLVVDDAAQTRESSLITPLCLTLNHILVFGDLCTSPPMVKSKVCYEAGFHNSLFQRLLKSKNVPHIKLAEQFLIEPKIFQFVKRFYSGKIRNESNVTCAAYNQHFANLEFPNYCFIDVINKDKNQDHIEIAGILYMLHILQNCWEDVNQNLHIAIVCIPNSHVYTMKDGLISKYAGDDKIKLSIMYADSIDGDMYDAVIISAFFKSRDQIDLKDMIAAITRARHCFWFLGDMSACPGTLGELVDDARDRKYLMKLDPQKLQMFNNVGDFPYSDNDSLMVGVESTWNGRPYRSKYILGLMRNQRNTDTCALHSSMTTTESQYKFKYAGQEPPEEFDWILCTCDFNNKYEDVVDKGIGHEVIEHRGSKRLETLHSILENPGVLGYKRLQPEVKKLFNVKSCSKLEIKENADMCTALASMDAGSVLVGNYRVSRNYFSLKPGQVYHYDRTMPYLNPRSSLPYSHAVMMIGSGTELTKLPNRGRKFHLNFQNSAGNLFGDNGFGKVGSTSVRDLYRITV